MRRGQSTEAFNHCPVLPRPGGGRSHRGVETHGLACAPRDAARLGLEGTNDGRETAGKGTRLAFLPVGQRKAGTTFLPYFRPRPCSHGESQSAPASTLSPLPSFLPTFLRSLTTLAAPDPWLACLLQAANLARPADEPMPTGCSLRDEALLPEKSPCPCPWLPSLPSTISPFPYHGNSLPVRGTM